MSTLIDNHGRPINYLRLAVTDRCNLRCYYCMPENGIKFEPREILLSYEEMLRLINIMAGMGVSKVRITGGEPFVRRDLMKFLKKLVKIPGIKKWHLTTNGVLTWQYLDELKQLGISSMNLSLDTLDKKRFFKITRRDELENVLKTFYMALEQNMALKINCVVMDSVNTVDIRPLAELARDHPISVRFIEEMPFNGDETYHPTLKWNSPMILNEIKSHFPDIRKKEDGPNSTSSNYEIPGFQGDVGIIAAYSRTFCGSCDRIRVTAQGLLKTCLYDGGVFSIRDLLRSTHDDEVIKDALMKVINTRSKDGFEAESQRSSNLPATESMSTIGG